MAGGRLAKWCISDSLSDHTASFFLRQFRLYIRKVEQHYGITKTRPVYERAITDLNDDDSRAMCIEFATMESKLGEVDRARAIYQHGSQFADPRKFGDYWAKWKQFEEMYGNEDTFREMLRIQRSVETANSQVRLTCLLSVGDARR